MVNKNVLTARLERLREYLEILKAVQGYDLKRFVEDPFIHGTAERNLHLAIECLLDIGNHVISDRDYPKPENYADIFRILHDRGVIPVRLLDDLKGMAAFRNVLVHDYLRLDREKVYRIVREKTEVMEKLAAIYAGML
ncbi:MAG: DUF86 domain-containing protein [Desulfobulbaceae bacterium]|nr:DUF86 domain-containing protein [Desulfobulbaceae bacterium]